MSKIVKVIVEQAEGLTEDMKPFTYEGELCVEQAETKLRQIAANGPELGYFKTDVEVTLSDGTTVGLRMDVERLGTPDNDIEILPHLRRYLETYSGRVVPDVYRNEYTPEQWLNIMVIRNGAEATMELARCLEMFNS